MSRLVVDAVIGWQARFIKSFYIAAALRGGDAADGLGGAAEFRKHDI